MGPDLVFGVCMPNNAEDITILMVEDEDAHATLIERTLRRVGLSNHIVRARNGQEAVRVARHACSQVKQPEPVLLDTLAMALAETGEFDIAIATANQARELAQRRGQAGYAQQIQNRIDLYRQGKPFRRRR